MHPRVKEPGDTLSEKGRNSAGEKGASHLRIVSGEQSAPKQDSGDCVSVLMELAAELNKETAEFIERYCQEAEKVNPLRPKITLVSTANLRVSLFESCKTVENLLTSASQISSCPQEVHSAALRLQTAIDDFRLSLTRRMLVQRETEGNCELLMDRARSFRDDTASILKELAGR